jgi:putative DNA primase/helicase
VRRLTFNRGHRSRQARELTRRAALSSLRPRLECVALQNGILHLPTREIITHTPRFWSPYVLDFDYDPSARAPRFERFLQEIWPGDEEAQQCLLEVMGLCFTDITKYQKAFMLIGPKRGGRGTIGRVLKGLIGAGNYAGSSLKAFSEPFGMESLIGKKVAVFSDARLDGMLQRNLSNIVERLLLITGQDDIPINRKHSKYYEGPLTARCIIFSNELLKFPDASGALPGRFITFRMTQSFFGREDVNLTEKLLAERPGIFNLALNAFDQLRDAAIYSNPRAELKCLKACTTSPPISPCSSRNVVKSAPNIKSWSINSSRFGKRGVPRATFATLGNQTNSPKSFAQPCRQ